MPERFLEFPQHLVDCGVTLLVSLPSGVSSFLSVFSKFYLLWYIFSPLTLQAGILIVLLFRLLQMERARKRLHTGIITIFLLPTTNWYVFIRFKRRVSKSLQSIVISIVFVLQMARGIN